VLDPKSGLTDFTKSRFPQYGSRARGSLLLYYMPCG